MDLRGCKCWVFCIQHLPCLESFWCMLEGRVEVWTIYIGSLSVKLILACQEYLKRIWHSMNWNAFLPPNFNSNTTSKHAPWVKINCGDCMQNDQWNLIGDQLPTKCLLELDDNTGVSSKVDNCRYYWKQLHVAFAWPWTKIIEVEQSDEHISKGKHEGRRVSGDILWEREEGIMFCNKCNQRLHSTHYTLVSIKACMG